MRDWLPVIVNIIIAAFIYGGLYVQVRNHTDDIKKLEETDRKQWDRLDDHGQRIAAVEAQCDVRHGPNGRTNYTTGGAD